MMRALVSELSELDEKSKGRRILEILRDYSKNLSNPSRLSPRPIVGTVFSEPAQQIPITGAPAPKRADLSPEEWKKIDDQNMRDAFVLADFEIT